MLSGRAWQLPTPHGVTELLEILCENPDWAERVLQLATAELLYALMLEDDLDLITGDADCNDFEVPSVEGHVQNAYHEGLSFLVQALVACLPQAAAADRDNARSVATSWAKLPGRVGLRLFLHAMRDVNLFGADEAIERLLSATDVEFWEIRREVVLLLLDRARTSSSVLVGRIEDRILHEGDALLRTLCN